MTYIVVPVEGGGGTPPTLTQLTPITDGSNAGVGQVGELTSANTAALTIVGIGASGAWGSATSLLLQPGVWEIFGNANFAENTAVMTDFISVGVSDSATAATIGPFDFTQYTPWLVGQPLYVLTPIKRVSIAVPTTYYLNTKFNYSSGTPQHAGIIWAMRYS